MDGSVSLRDPTTDITVALERAELVVLTGCSG